MYSTKRICYVLALSGLATSAMADGSLNEALGRALYTPVETSTQEVVIFPAAKVITMEKPQQTAEAVAVTGKRILGIGSVAQLEKLAGDRSLRVDERLKDKIIMPGFIDQHLHPVLGALTLATEVIATEDWNLPGRSIKAAYTPDEYLSRLKDAEKN